MRLDAFSGAGRRLDRALRQSAARAGLDALVLSTSERPWASATFIGAHHQIVLGIPSGTPRYRWLAALAEAELPMRGHVALPPAIVTADDERVTLEIVTLESH